MYKKGLFKDWVPKPVQLLLIFILMVPLLTINGIYTSNIGDMAGGLGIMTDDLMMANYAAMIGMAVAFPLLLRVKQYFKSKDILLTIFLSFALLNYVSSTTDHPAILTAANFMLGALKMFGMIEIIIPIMFIVSPTGDRAKFYSVFYPISIGLGMISGYLTTELAFDSNWQHIYQFAIPISLFCVLLVLIFSHDYYGGKRVPLYQFDWISLVLYSSVLMLINYVFSYGKTFNWLDSLNIKAALISFVILGIWFIQRQLTLKRPYISLSILKKKNVQGAIFFIFLMGLFNSSSSIQSAFTTGILKYSAQVNSELNLMMIAGCILGGLLCFIWFKKQKRLKGIVFIGFSAFITYYIILYFMFSSVIDINYLLFPILLKGLGMTIIFISIGIYAAEKLGMADMMASASLLVLFRSFFGPLFWGAVLSFQLYAGQMKHTARIVQHIDINDPLYVSRVTPVVQGAIAQGKTIEVAQSMGVQSMWGTVQVQATLAASKDIFGHIIVIGGITLLIVLFYPFTPINLRRLVSFRKKFRKKELVKDEEEMMAAVAP
jgi:hypothetical protein